MAWDLTGNTNTNNSNFLGTTDNKPLVIRTNNTDRVAVDVNGNVGIGTSNPGSKVEIHAQDGLQIVGFQPFLTLSDSNNNAFQRVRIQDANGDVAIFTESGFSSGVPAVVIKNGTNTVQISGQDGLQIVGFQPFLTLSDSNNAFRRVRIQDANGDIVIFTESSFSSGVPAMVIKDSGDVKVRVEGTLHTKDVLLTGGDCAEHFDVAPDAECEAGTVVVVNAEGCLEPSTFAYDKRVTGVISGAGALGPGIILGKRATDDGRLPVALVGKVYCKVDAQQGGIEVGDLLTTSDIPGFAMKARESDRAFGAVIGKALRPLSAGQALIPILVALQ